MSRAVLILAGGFGRRMGAQDKLLVDIDGMPLLRRIALRALSAVPEVFVALGATQSDRRQALVGLDIHCVCAPNTEDGMSATLQAGVRALPSKVSALAVTLADLPDLQGQDFLDLFDRFEADTKKRVHRACDSHGRPGHPVIFPKALFPNLQSLTGDHGARDLLKTLDVVMVPRPGDRATFDLDRPEQLAAWRKKPGH